MGSWAVKQDENGLYTCRNCGEKFSAKESRRRVYCSQECLDDYKRVGGPKKKTCEQCGDFYEPNPRTAKRQRFCTRDCERAWWSENRDQRKTYTYICNNCGEEYEAKEKNRDSFCSLACVGEFNSKRAQINKQCLVCKTVFVGTQSSSDYCSSECRSIGITYTTTCIQCGREFEPPYANTQVCSEECRLERGRERYEQYMTEQVGDRRYTCKECDTEFIAPYGDKRREFCSLKCRRKFGKRYRKYQKRVNGKVQKISSKRVFTRDGWRCGVCGGKVDPQLEHPHPMSASLDHIIPISKGGTHTWGNVQCTHLKCNREKSDIGGGQLRLGITHEAC